MNREEWLTRTAEEFGWPLILGASDVAKRPDVYRVALGWPSRGRGARGSLGECWHSTMSADNAREIFISPKLAAGGEAGAVATLLHEQCHAALPDGVGHKGAFPKLVTAIGLEGKPTATVAGAALLKLIEAWIKNIGPYPHAPLTPDQKRGAVGSRLIKCECTHCGFVFRTTYKWLQATGGQIQCPDPSCSNEVKVS